MDDLIYISFEEEIDKIAKTAGKRKKRKASSLKDAFLPLKSSDPKVRAAAEFRRDNTIPKGGPFLGELNPGKKGAKYRRDLKNYVESKASIKGTAKGGIVHNDYWDDHVPMQEAQLREKKFGPLRHMTSGRAKKLRESGATLTAPPKHIQEAYWRNLAKKGK